VKEISCNSGLLSQYSKKLLVRLVLLSGLISLALIVLLGVKADWSELFSTLRWEWLGAAAVMLIVMQFVSGYRLYSLLPETSTVQEGQYLNSVQVMFSFQALIKLLPFRLGEAAFFWVAQKNLGLSFRENLGVFLSFRIWDFRIVSLSFLLFGGLLFRDKVPWGQTAFIMVGGFGAFMFFLSSHKLTRLGEMAFRCLYRLASFKWADRFADALAEASASLKAMKSVRGSMVTGVLSGAVWLVYFVVFYSLFNCVGVPIGWAEAIVVVSGMILVGILPIQTIGGIGLLELGQASLLVLAGLSPTMAASKSLAVGALFLGLSLAVPALLAGIFVLRGDRAVVPQ
jgi:uncharacterized membrane protein YbhN (UPF0104 family)